MTPIQRTIFMVRDRLRVPAAGHKAAFAPLEGRAALIGYNLCVLPTILPVGRDLA
jgi:hypothetical protein